MNDLPRDQFPTVPPRATAGKVTAQLQERIRSYMMTMYGKDEYCPLLENLERIHSPYSDLTTAQKIEAEFRIAEFLYPKLKSVDVNVKETVDIRMDVVNRIVERLKTKVIEATVEPDGSVS